MANAVIPRIQGDEYQARVFWIEATRLFATSPVATSVGFEVDGVRAFDDVAVFYGPNGCGTDPQVRADFYQVKFHVSNAGSFTAAALIDPEFIGAASISLLERLRDAQRRHAPTGAEARFIIISPWPIDSTDSLAKIVGNKSGEIRLSVLKQGGPRTEMGRVRKMWRERLNLDSDEELYTVLAGLRIRPDYPSLDGLRDRLNPLLVHAGMRPYEDGKLVHAYDTLPAKLLQEGKTRFTREELEGILARESLLLAERTRPPRPAGRQIGIRSFARWAEKMEDETDAMLCLLEQFDGRSVHDHALWAESILPTVSRFLTGEGRGSRDVDVHLDTHTSIAFAAGWVLDPKSGVVASPVQRSLASGRTVWCVADCPPCRDPKVWDEQRIPLTDGGPDIALVLNVTRSALDEAVGFIGAHVTSANSILSLTPCQGVGSNSVRDAAHARRLADEAANLVHAALAAHPRHARVHVFAAAPNGLVFFLGQAAHVWGRVVLYEYDMERTRPLPYAASIELPPPR